MFATVLGKVFPRAVVRLGIRSRVKVKKTDIRYDMVLRTLAAAMARGFFAIPRGMMLKEALRSVAAMFVGR